VNPAVARSVAFFEWPARSSKASTIAEQPRSVRDCRQDQWTTGSGILTRARYLRAAMAKSTDFTGCINVKSPAAWSGTLVVRPPTTTVRPGAARLAKAQRRQMRTLYRSRETEPTQDGNGGRPLERNGVAVLV
jgi:hypothetical protein